MRSGDKLQDEIIARENAKIDRKRDLFEQRRLRILNAKVRLIGLDVQTLNSQVAEKQRLKQVQGEEDRFARAQAMEIERILAASIEEEKQMKQFQMSEMKKSWEAQKTMRWEKAQEPRSIDFDVDHSGPSAALRFVGEDPYRKDRIGLQKAQVQKWIQEQLSEKAQLRHLLKEEDMSYAEMIKAIDEIRAQTEKEEREMRAYIQDTVKAANKDLAAEQGRRNKYFNSTVNENNDPVMTSLEVFNNEDKNLAMDGAGRIIRVDMFKGFTEEQRKRILLDNQALIQSKNAARMAEKQEEYEQMVTNLLALRAMEQAEYDEKQLKDNLKNDQLDYLRYQMEQQAKDRLEWDKTKHGDIRGGFFDGFGQSCR